MGKIADSIRDVLPLPQRYLDEAARPEGERAVRARLPAKLRQVSDTRLIGLVKDTYGYATDPRISTRYKILALAALLYFISPIDAVSDFVPGLGYLDDAAVLTALVAAVREATKEVVSHTRQETGAVVSQAISEAREAWAHRGVSQVCLSLWATTIAASVGLLYYGTRTLVFGSAADATMHDPFFWGCMVAGVVGVGYHLVFARRVWVKYSTAPPQIKEPLAHAIVSLADWRQIAMLSLPAVTLVALIALRIGLTSQR